MLFIRTIEGITDTLGKFMRGEQAISFHHPTLAMQPFGFNWVEPGAFDGQIARQYPHSVTSSFIFDLVVVLPDPLTDLFADMPGSIIPHQHEHSLAHLPQLMAAPLQV